MYICLKSHMSFVSIIAVYAPTNPVSSTADAVTYSKEISMGVGGDSHSWHSVIGSHTLGEHNDNGTRLLDFWANNHLIVSNMWFQHKPVHQATWFQNGDRSRTGHMIDFVLVHSRFR